MFKEVKNFEYITIAEAKELMEKIVEERKKELLFETRRALKHLKTFAKLPAEKARDLVEELLKLPQVPSKEIAIKIVDIMPRIPDEIRMIYAKDRTLKTEEIEQILEILERYR